MPDETRNFFEGIDPSLFYQKKRQAIPKRKYRFMAIYILRAPISTHFAGFYKRVFSIVSPSNSIIEELKLNINGI
jgi:AAA15 family ATPase/GTPase